MKLGETRAATPSRVEQDHQPEAIPMPRSDSPDRTHSDDASSSTSEWEEQLQAAGHEGATDRIPLGSMRLKPLDMSVLDNQRFAPPSPSGLPSPQTPPHDFMERYTHPNKLPGPTGAREHHDGRYWIPYGDTRVLEEGRDTHEQLRRYAAKVPPREGELYSKPQKYLAFLEQNNGMSHWVVPYQQEGTTDKISSSAPIPSFVRDVRIMDDVGHVRPAAHLNKSGMWDAVVTYPTNVGRFVATGALKPPVDVAMHEYLGHAAVQQSIGNLSQENKLLELAGRWENKSEQIAETKIANPAALAHGRGLRDDHLITVPFETKDFMSNIPVDPEVAAQIKKAQPSLIESTNRLDAMHADPTKPFETDDIRLEYENRDRRIYGLRERLHDRLAYEET